LSGDAGGGHRYPDSAAEEARNAWELAMHVIGVHANSAGIHNSYADNRDFHGAEHSGPGGLRLHEPARLDFDPGKVEQILEEAEDAEGIRAGLRCPDGGKCHHGCGVECFRVQSAAPLSGVYPDGRWPACIARLHDPLRWRNGKHGDDPIEVARYRRYSGTHTAQDIWAVLLTTTNWYSVIGWLAENSVYADWTADPDRLHYGSRLGSFATPPGYWIAIPYGDFGAEGIEPEEFTAHWRLVAG
jgi:hypothetical protein